MQTTRRYTTRRQPCVSPPFANMDRRARRSPSTTVLKEWRAPRLTARGFAGPGHGRVSYVEAPVEWTGSTTQVCGLYPFVVGGGAPSVGVPLGPSLLTGATVCCDPISWF